MLDVTSNKKWNTIERNLKTNAKIGWNNYVRMIPVISWMMCNGNNTKEKCFRCLQNISFSKLIGQNEQTERKKFNLPNPLLRFVSLYCNKKKENIVRKPDYSYFVNSQRISFKYFRIIQNNKVQSNTVEVSLCRFFV